MTQPTIDFSKLSGESLYMASQVFKKDGSFYASKPKKASGDGKYVWRMLAFFISSNPMHQCMPVCASFDLETYGDDGKWSSRLAQVREKELQAVIDEILNQIPLRNQAGTRRWLKAFGG